MRGRARQFIKELIRSEPDAALWLWSQNPRALLFGIPLLKGIEYIKTQSDGPH
jgi:hypothetical protein